MNENRAFAALIFTVVAFAVAFALAAVPWAGRHLVLLAAVAGGLVLAARLNQPDEA